MGEEIKKILNMLEEGKISADEAERLIRAIGSSKSAEPFDKRFVDAMDKVGKNISTAVLGAIKSVHFEGKEEIGKPERIKIALGTGDLYIGASKDDMAHLDIDGVHSLRREKGRVSLAVGSGDASIMLPDRVDCDVKIGRGDFELEDVECNLELKLGSGDASVAPKGFDTLEAKLGNGDFEMKLPENIECEIHIETGKDCDVELPKSITNIEEKVIRRSLGEQKKVIDARIGENPKKKVKIYLGNGDITIKQGEQ